MSLLELDGLTKHFSGLVAVDDVSFSVDRGEIVGLIGPNGSGKSTLFDCVMGVHDVTDGQVRFDGADVTDDPTHETVNRGLARVSQESNPIESMTVAGNVKLFTLPNSVLSFRGGASQAEVAAYADEVGLADKLDESPDELTHADVRRLEVAKALATEPELLLLDEPFAGMNQAEIRGLSEQIEGFREDGLTMIIVDHNMRGLMQLVDRVVVLHSGELIAQGGPGDVAEDERVQQAYLGSDGGAF